MRRGGGGRGWVEEGAEVLRVGAFVVICARRWLSAVPDAFTRRFASEPGSRARRVRIARDQRSRYCVVGAVVGGMKRALWRCDTRWMGVAGGECLASRRRLGTIRVSLVAWRQPKDCNTR